MTQIDNIFSRIEKLTNSDRQCELLSALKLVMLNEEPHVLYEAFLSLISFLHNIFEAVDELASEIRIDSTILISVKNQKLLRTCFQLIISFGISPSLIPGLGIKTSKKSAANVPQLFLTDEQKYKVLVNCTDFLIRSYNIPVLKNIIITLYLSDYLSSLIQLSFAPFKKPGTYNNFTMTQEMCDKLIVDRQRYVQVYNHLTANCFQPILIKELLALQSAKDPAPPVFAKRVIAKELSQRLLSQGGLLSLIRCFIESYNIDTGFEWRKVDMISRIVVAKHGTSTESNYLSNICSQLKQILSLNNTHYLGTAAECVLNLSEKYPHSEHVITLIKEIFQDFDTDYLIANYNLPGTIIFTSQQVEHQVNILYAFMHSPKLDWSTSLIVPNLYILFMIGVNCTLNDELKFKIKDILLRCLEKLNNNELNEIFKEFLFGKNKSNLPGIVVEEYDAGVVIKCVPIVEAGPKEAGLVYFLNLFPAITNEDIILNIFQISLKVLIELSVKRQRAGNKDILLIEDEPELINDIDQQYAVMLQLLSEISTSPKIVVAIKKNPLVVSDFIEHFLKNSSELNDECISIALVLLTTILSNSVMSADFERQSNNLIPMLRKICDSDSSLNNLCQEALSLITSGHSIKKHTPCEKALNDIFDNLLPVRAHGIIELTKLIEAKDAETISKKHYIFCIFQEQLKDADSYLYLSAINGLASLCTYCTEDVLHILCKEFLQLCDEPTSIGTKDSVKAAELRMKIGDIIVKVTKRLGEMAVVQKAILLNTMLCGCRDEDPLIRTSALSNLAEIALVLHYRIGTVIYEVLLCIWSIIETDEAVECRRAAVMVVTSLIKGLGKDTLIELKESLLPIYRTLKKIYVNDEEDSIVRLHAQLALEELKDVVVQFLFPKIEMEKEISFLDTNIDLLK